MIDVERRRKTQGPSTRRQSHFGSLVYISPGHSDSDMLSFVQVRVPARSAIHNIIALVHGQMVVFQSPRGFI